MPPSDDKYQSYALAITAIEELKAKKIYLVGDTSSDAGAYSKPIFEKLDKELLGVAKFLSDQTTRSQASSIASNIRQAQPDLVVFCGYWTNFQLIIGALSDLYRGIKNKPKILLSDGCMNNEVTTQGFDVFITFPSPDIESAETNLDEIKFLKELIKRQGYQSYELFGYDALLILSQAILESKKEGISRSSLIGRLSSKESRLKGIAFDYSFEEGENTRGYYYIYHANTKKFSATISSRDIESFKNAGVEAR